MRVQRSLILFALLIAAFMIAPPTSPLWSSSSSNDFAAAPTAVPEKSVARRTPVKARGIIVSGYTAGGSRFPKLMDMIEETELNTVVLDIKNEAGEVSWIPRKAAARAIGAGIAKIKDPKATIATLKNKNIYVIGRIVVFKDPILAQVRPDLAIRDNITGNAWKDRKEAGWGDPYSSEVWTYNLALAEEAVEFGFDEIQFDYIRFPSDGSLDRTLFAHRDLRPPVEVVQQFLRTARKTIAPKGAYISADLFGFTTIVDDPGIGQRLDVVAREVDYLSLMLYPSHYSKGNYDLADPEKSPAETVSKSLADAKRRIAGTRAKLRPWLQDFSLRVHYTPKEVRAQIDAAEDSGVGEWLLWNARNVYSMDALHLSRSSRVP